MKFRLKIDNGYFAARTVGLAVVVAWQAVSR
jgi:hypothetical protein